MRERQVEDVANVNVQVKLLSNECLYGFYGRGDIVAASIYAHCSEGVHDILGHEISASLQRHGVQGECGPQLNEPRDPAYWLGQPGAPKPKLADEKPQGKTVAYDELIKSWQSD